MRENPVPSRLPSRLGGEKGRGVKEVTAALLYALPAMLQMPESTGHWRPTQQAWHAVVLRRFQHRPARTCPARARGHGQDLMRVTTPFRATPPRTISLCDNVRAQFQRTAPKSGFDEKAVLTKMATHTPPAPSPVPRPLLRLAEAAAVRHPWNRRQLASAAAGTMRASKRELGNYRDWGGVGVGVEGGAMEGGREREAQGQSE
jgi:hypothetical protein